MGYEVRRVPQDWQHPKDAQGDFLPLHDGAKFAKRAAAWDEEAAKWAEGFRTDWNGGWVELTAEQKRQPYSTWDGERPDPKDYMPLWRDDERTHFMLYENVTEGTPVSPIFATAEELARWRAGSSYAASSYASALPSLPGKGGGQVMRAVTMGARSLVAAMMMTVCSLAFGAGIEDSVLLASQMHQNTAAVVNGRPARVVYVGEHGGCSQVAVIWKGIPQQNFQVCGNQVQDKHSVAPAWPEDKASQEVLFMVAQDAMRYGRAAGVDGNGYRIAANISPDMGGCMHVEVLISYDGDLSGMYERRQCGGSHGRRR